MRMLHLFDDARAAETLSDALYADGVETSVRETREGQHALWVHDESQMDAAKAMLARFEASPADPIFEERKRAARAQRKAEEAREKKSRHRVEKMRDQLARAEATPFVTYGIMAFSVGLYFLVEARPEIGRAMLPYGEGFTITEAILNGLMTKPWTFFSPVFVHGGLLHLIFNVLWIRDLGSAMERVHSSLRMFGATLLFGVGGVITELYWSHAPAVGLSGVVYGLLGYLYVRGKYDPGFPIRVPRSTMLWMMAWFVLCFVPGFRVANGAHTAGLVLGAVWGYLASGDLRRRLLRK
ncbi:MAG: rhomboid family intramembrane serine protease [Sandaracinus sp.]|nr:rhomboid family intramembrane serine protease [Sandaracinus sp.]MCB9635952.1 rhomboid family intramembrane serine protease [Sandaracinus sp.]